MSGTPAEIQAYVSSQCLRRSEAGESRKRSMLHPTDDGGSLDRIERVYREHSEVEDIAVFSDRLGQRVALVVSEVTEADLREVLDEIASHSSECVCITEFVALAPDDPLVPPMFIAGDQRRDLIWHLLVGCIDTLTRAADRMSATGGQPSAGPRCSRMRNSLARHGAG
jgi:hypothetical protein